MRKPDTFHECSVSFEGAEKHGANHLPYFHRRVLATACERFSGRVKHHAVNAASVALKRVQQLAAGHLPNSHRLVLATGR